MTTPSDDAARPVPVRVVLPADPALGQPEQEVVARLWRRRQTETGWVYLVGLPSYRDLEDGGVEAAEYRVWVRAPDHVRPVDGVDYDQVPTEPLPPAPPTSVVREVVGERRPSGWVLAKVREGRGPARGVLHAPDCEEAPEGAPLFDVQQALDLAENPGRSCARCGGCAQELTPLLSGFDHITDPDPDPPPLGRTGDCAGQQGCEGRTMRAMSTDEPDVPSTDFQPGDSLTGSAWPGILATAVPVATAVTVAGRVAKAHIEQRGATERTAIEQRGETQRAVIAAEVERERIRQPQLPAGDGDAA